MSVEPNADPATVVGFGDEWTAFDQTGVADAEWRPTPTARCTRCARTPSDRFGTRLEQRFTREQTVGMLTRTSFEDVRFSDNDPFWCAVGIRTAEPRV